MSNKRNAEILASEVKGIQTLNNILKGRGYTRQLVHRLVQITHQQVIRKQELEDLYLIGSSLIFIFIIQG